MELRTAAAGVGLAVVEHRSAAVFHAFSDVHWVVYKYQLLYEGSTADDAEETERTRSYVSVTAPKSVKADSSSGFEVCTQPLCSRVGPAH